MGQNDILAELIQPQFVEDAWKILERPEQTEEAYLGAQLILMLAKRN